MDRTQGGTSAILPFDVGELLVKPVYEQSIALNVFKTLETTKESIHIPVVEEGVTAEFVGELETYGTDSVELSEIEIKPRKIGKTVPASTELVDDSDPAAADIVGDQLTRAIAEGIDRYVFGNQAESAKAFAGLDNKTKYNITTLDAGDGATWDLDAFIDAQSIVEGSNYVVGAYVMNSADKVLLSKIKEADGSRRGLLNVDPQLPSRFLIGGAPIITTNLVPAGTVWGIDPFAARVVVRDDALVEVDRSVGFNNDSVWFKGRMRVGFGVTDKRGIVRLTRTI